MNRLHRILAVDDDAMNRIILDDYLSEDYEIVLAEDGEQCLEILETFRPDLILLDIMMPGIDGYEVCRRIRANSNFRHTKIVLVSAKASTEERMQGYEAGANDYITKPFAGDELLAKVKVYLELASIQELEELKSQFLALLSHETRTPLTGVLGSSLILMDLIEEGTEAREFVDAIFESAKRWEQTVRTGLRICEFKADAVRLEIHPFDFGDLVEEAMSLVAAVATAKRLEFEWEREPGELLIDTDHNAMIQGLEGLLRRSVHGAPEDSTIRLVLSSSEDLATLTLRDASPPVPESWRPFVFHDFMVPDISRHTGDAELDLALCASVVRRLGGKIDARFEEEIDYVISMPRQLAVVTNDDASDLEPALTV